MNDINPITDPDARMVNGPVNVIRMEGNVHGVPKVIYLYMDFHVPVGGQTQCANVFSQDVQKYFVDNFYRLNEGDRVYDFFLEVYPSELADERYRKGIIQKDYKEKYIEEVVQLFKKIFKYDAKKNKVQINKLFQNVRLHYLDIRDYYKHNVHYRTSEITNIARSFMATDNIDLHRLERIINLMEVMKNHMQYIVDILSSKPTKTKPQRQKIIKLKQMDRGPDIQAIEYLANKLKTLYNHKDVQKEMLILIDQTVDSFDLAIKEINEAMERFYSYGKMIMESGDRLVKDKNTTYVYTYGLSHYTIREMIVDIVNSTEKLLDERFVEFFARFTDIYFLRRFLDKDYITNAIVYSGALHSNTYIHFLVQQFDFKITHASFSKIENMDKLNNEIKKRSLMNVQELILPQKFEQCSNMEGFPEEFL